MGQQGVTQREDNPYNASRMRRERLRNFIEVSQG
jgi:hypothetical protein